MKDLSQRELACSNKAELPLLLHKITAEPAGGLGQRAIGSSLLPWSCCVQHDHGISARRAADQPGPTLSPASSASDYGRAQSPFYLLTAHRSWRA